MVIDLFRPAIHTEKALANLREVLTPDAEGRIYCGEGQKVVEFEQRFGELVGATTPPLMVNSGTSALELAVYLAAKSKGFDAGHCCEKKYVISTPMTCTATNGAIVRNGLGIVWADVDPITGLIDTESVDALLERSYWSNNVVAIMAVDWGGRLCDYYSLRSHGLPIIQDAAHSLLAYSACGLMSGGAPGSREDGPYAYLSGSAGGDYVCYSLQAIKHLTTGDGGMLLVPPAQYDRARLLRWYGLDRLSSADFRYAQNIQEIGWKAQSNDIAAAIGLANLEVVEDVVERQRYNAENHSSLLGGLRCVTLPPPDTGSSWWLFTLLLNDRDTFIQFMASRGVQCSPVHARNDKHDAFKKVSSGGPLPGVDAFSSREVAIPVHWALSNSDLLHIAGAVWEWAGVSPLTSSKELTHA